MAKVIFDPKTLPERIVPIPGSNAPISILPFKDLGHPEEVESFRELIREIRNQSSIRPE